MSGVLLTILLDHVQIGGLTQHIMRSNPTGLLAAAVLSVGTGFLSGLRWWILADRRMSWGDAVAYTFEGLFFNHLLPTNFGGDGTRVLRVRLQLGGTAKALATVLWDRVAGLVGLVLTGGCAYAAGQGISEQSVLVWVYPAVAAAVLGFAGVLLHGSGRRSPLSLVPKRWQSLAAAPPWRGFRRAVFLSVFLQLTGILSVYALAFGLRLDDVTLPACLVYLPLANLVSMLPVSVSGIGVREGAMVYLFSLSGVPADQALTLSLGWFVLSFSTSLWGGVVFLLRGKPADGRFRKVSPPHERLPAESP